MLDPVETCVLDFGRKALLYLTAFEISDEDTGSALVTNILLKRARHKLYAVGG